MNYILSLCLFAVIVEFAYGGCQTCYRQQAYDQNYYTSCGMFGWSRCARTRTAYRQTSYSCKCSVNGGWSGWSTAITWRGSCSTTCGAGTESGFKTRTCTNPSPQNGGNACSGSSTQEQYRSCKVKECPVNGGWTSFSDVTWNNDCSAPCGTGTATGYKTRACTNPSPAHGGRYCSGSASQTISRSCLIKECPIDGKWSEFSPVTWNNDCSSTCDYGVETGTKTRSCTNPAPAHGGKTCDGASSAIEIRQCKHKECPIDGGWGDFSSITWTGDCSTTCDFGIESGTKTRSCTNPSPAYGGKPCLGDSSATETRECKLKECPIDGGWSEFSPITWHGDCSMTCDSGIETGSRTRSCTNPVPAYGGKECSGESNALEHRQCKLRECPIDGGWTDFSPITWHGDCSTTCDIGVESGIKTRSCTNPAPAHGGKDCDGMSHILQNRQCKLRECPIDGGWSEYGPFTEWSSCSVTCGEGLQTRSHERTCTNPVPQYGGKDCDGEPTQTVSKSCDMKKCPDTICSELGQGHFFTAHLQQCDKYLNCLNGVVTVMSCSNGTEWDEDLKTCDHPKEGSTCLSAKIIDSAVTCTFNGEHFAHPTDCHKFYQCVGSTPNEITCANGLAWNDEISNCDHPENVELCNEAGDIDGDAEDDTNESEVTEEFECGTKTGYFADPVECTKYYWCVAGQKYHMPCPGGTHFEGGTCKFGEC